MAKINEVCFCYFTVAMLVHLHGAPTWPLHNNARMKRRKDLNLDEAAYISIIYHIPAC